jgi:hypothetical protein
MPLESYEVYIEVGKRRNEMKNHNYSDVVRIAVPGNPVTQLADRGRLLNS